MEIKLQYVNSQEITPFQNNSNENLTLGENNFNIPEQNQNFNDNEDENNAPPPVLNYNNDNNI